MTDGDFKRPPAAQYTFTLSELLLADAIQVAQVWPNPVTGNLVAERIRTAAAALADKPGETITSPGTITCDSCAFRFGAEHDNTDGSYNCPICEYHQLATAVKKYLAAIDDDDAFTSASKRHAWVERADAAETALRALTT